MDTAPTGTKPIVGNSRALAGVRALVEQVAAPIRPSCSSAKPAPARSCLPASFTS